MICHNVDSCFHNFDKIIEQVYLNDPKIPIYKGLLDKTKVWLQNAQKSKNQNNESFVQLDTNNVKIPLGKSQDGNMDLIKKLVEDKYVGAEIFKHTAIVLNRCYELLDKLAELKQNKALSVDIVNLQNEIVSSSKFWKLASNFNTDILVNKDLLDNQTQKSLETTIKNFEKQSNTNNGYNDFKMTISVMDENRHLNSKLADLQSKYDGRVIYEDEFEKLGEVVVSRKKEHYFLEGKIHKLERENEELRHYIKDRAARSNSKKKAADPAKESEAILTELSPYEVNERLTTPTKSILGKYREKYSPSGEKNNSSTKKKRVSFSQEKLQEKNKNSIPAKPTPQQKQIQKKDNNLIKNKIQQDIVYFIAKSIDDTLAGRLHSEIYEEALQVEIEGLRERTEMASAQEKIEKLKKNYESAKTIQKNYEQKTFSSLKELTKIASLKGVQVDMIEKLNETNKALLEKNLEKLKVESKNFNDQTEDLHLKEKRLKGIVNDQDQFELDLIERAHEDMDYIRLTNLMLDDLQYKIDNEKKSPMNNKTKKGNPVQKLMDKNDAFQMCQMQSQMIEQLLNQSGSNVDQNHTDKLPQKIINENIPDNVSDISKLTITKEYEKNKAQNTDYKEVTRNLCIESPFQPINWSPSKCDMPKKNHHENLINDYQMIDFEEKLNMEIDRIRSEQNVLLEQNKREMGIKFDTDKKRILEDNQLEKIQMIKDLEELKRQEKYNYVKDFEEEKRMYIEKESTEKKRLLDEKMMIMEEKNALKQKHKENKGSNDPNLKKLVLDEILGSDELAEINAVFQEKETQVEEKAFLQQENRDTKSKLEDIKRAQDIKNLELTTQQQLLDTYYVKGNFVDPKSLDSERNKWNEEKINFEEENQRISNELQNLKLAMADAKNKQEIPNEFKIQIDFLEKENTNLENKYISLKKDYDKQNNALDSEKASNERNIDEIMKELQDEQRIKRDLQDELKDLQSKLRFSSLSDKMRSSVVLSNVSDKDRTQRSDLQEKLDDMQASDIKFEKKANPTNISYNNLKSSGSVSDFNHSTSENKIDGKLMPESQKKILDQIMKDNLEFNIDDAPSQNTEKYESKFAPTSNQSEYHSNPSDKNLIKSLKSNNNTSPGTKSDKGSKISQEPKASAIFQSKTSTNSDNQNKLSKSDIEKSSPAQSNKASTKKPEIKSVFDFSNIKFSNLKTSKSPTRKPKTVTFDNKKSLDSSRSQEILVKNDPKQSNLNQSKTSQPQSSLWSESNITEVGNYEFSAIETSKVIDKSKPNVNNSKNNTPIPNENNLKNDTSQKKLNNESNLQYSHLPSLHESKLYKEEEQITIKKATKKQLGGLKKNNQPKKEPTSSTPDKFNNKLYYREESVVLKDIVIDDNKYEPINAFPGFEDDTKHGDQDNLPKFNMSPDFTSNLSDEKSSNVENQDLYSLSQTNVALTSKSNSFKDLDVDDSKYQPQNKNEKRKGSFNTNEDKELFNSSTLANILHANNLFDEKVNPEVKFNRNVEQENNTSYNMVSIQELGDDPKNLSFKNIAQHQKADDNYHHQTPINNDLPKAPKNLPDNASNNNITSNKNSSQKDPEYDPSKRSGLFANNYDKYLNPKEQDIKKDSIKNSKVSNPKPLENTKKEKSKPTSKKDKGSPLSVKSTSKNSVTSPTTSKSKKNKEKDTPKEPTPLSRLQMFRNKKTEKDKPIDKEKTPFNARDECKTN